MAANSVFNQKKMLRPVGHEEHGAKEKCLPGIPLRDRLIPPFLELAQVLWDSDRVMVSNWGSKSKLGIHSTAAAAAMAGGRTTKI